jgi:ferritin-like protein
MNDRTIFGSLDAELIERVVTRRGALTQTGKMAGAVAIASVPVAFGLMARRAFAQAGGLPQDIVDVLNFALTLEYLEDEFYRLGLASGVIPSTDLPLFQAISAHESAHVALLQGVLGTSAVAKPTFDFTVGEVFDPFGDYLEFQALAQGLEDAGVRAYKGQLTALIANDDILTTALQIHSVEARHASAVRRLRGQKGWITGNQTDVPELQPAYDGEEAANGAATTPEAAEAFDEPLTMNQANAFAGIFIVA